LNKHIGIETIEICVIYRFFREDGNSMSKYPDFMDPKCSFRMFLMSINIIPIPISIPILRISPASQLSPHALHKEFMKITLRLTLLCLIPCSSAKEKSHDATVPMAPGSTSKDDGSC
jgi:hypothetical protein